MYHGTCQNNYVMGRTGKGKVLVWCHTCNRPIERYQSLVHEKVFCSRECRIIPIATRLWSKVDKSAGPDACWPFIGGLGSCGYGSLTIPRIKEYRAHRIAWIVTHGPIPDDTMVLHSQQCTTRACCNPAHLRLGNQTENMQDSIEQGTRNRPKGEKNPHSVLKELDVSWIRSVKGLIAAEKLAKKFNVTVGTIGHIWRKHTWKHVQ